MYITMITVLVLAVAVGISLGLLGGGGSILTVPLLTYVAGFPPKEAIASSLLVVGVTSISSMLAHARRGNVQWRTGLIFGTAGTAGAFAGGLVGGHIPGTVLMIAFAVMMVATAGAMIRGRRASTSRAVHASARPWVRIVLFGLGVGLVTGLVGAGGGFLVVPALALLAGLPMPAAVGTSLLVITMNSFAGLAGRLTTLSLDWALVAAVTAAAVAGSLLGARLTTRVSEETLRRGFGYFVLVMAVVVLVQELPGAAALVVVAVAVVVAAVGITCRLTRVRCPWVAQPGAS